LCDREGGGDGEGIGNEISEEKSDLAKHFLIHPCYIYCMENTFLLRRDHNEFGIAN